MIVVPAFSECKECEQEIITALILGSESPAADYMSERIYNESPVIQQNGTYEISPYQHLRASGAEFGCMQCELPSCNERHNG